MSRPKQETPSESGFAQRLVARRKACGLTQVQLAEKLGVSQRVLSHYETGSGYPTVPAVAKIAEALHCSTDSLLGRPEPKAPKAQAAAPAAPENAALKRLWKKFQQVAKLPDKDQRAVIRLVNSLAAH